MRNSGDPTPNERLQDVTDRSAPGRDASFRDGANGDFFGWAMGELERPGTVIVGLVGERDIPGVAVREAQGVLRWDHRPSLWSHAFLVAAPAAPDDVAGTPVAEVALYPRSGRFPEPAANGVERARLADFDRREDANVALLAVDVSEVADDGADRVRARAFSPNEDRLRFPLWETLGVWAGYVWRRDTETNPLREGFPVPSSAFVEYCFEAILLDLVPGASERNSSPEHLWGAAKWWASALADFGVGLSGFAVIRDPGCSLLDAPLPEPPPQRDAARES